MIQTSLLDDEPAPPKEKKFVKPTVKEVADYARSIGFSINAEHFCDYYEMVGWRVGGKAPMKDWKAAVRTWKHNYAEKAPQARGMVPFTGGRRA